MKNDESGRRLKRVEPRQTRDGFVVVAVGRNRGKTQAEHSAAAVRARAGRDVKNPRKYTPRSAYDGSTAHGRPAARAEYKCKRREYAADPLAIPFTSRHSYAPAVTVRPESRGGPPSANLHPLIGARER